MRAQEMLRTHPETNGHSSDALIRCIEDCYDCAQVCTACADACLAEPMVAELAQCIRLNLDCADICDTTGAIATRRTGINGDVVKRLIETCAEACRLCAEECASHADQHEHCRVCAEACRSCEAACRKAIETLPWTLQ